MKKSYYILLVTVFLPITASAGHHPASAAQTAETAGTSGITIAIFAIVVVGLSATAIWFFSKK